MSETLHQRPAEAAYDGGTPSQGELLQRKEQLRAATTRAVTRVSRLVEDQHALSRELGGEIAAMQAQRAALDELEAQAADTGLLAALTRAFARRRSILQRRSVAEGLLERYEAASRCLRRAAAFTDELQLCTLELQEHVDGIHADIDRTTANRRAAARRVLALEQALERLEQQAGPDVDAPTADRRERRRDQLQFEQRSEALSLELFEARLGLLRQELGPARSLRDTVMQLHQEMARFTLAATSTINTAGRRIQALGVAADAPTVIAELRESMGELGEAMEATEQYVEQAQDLLTRVLPDLSARVEAGHRADALALVDDLEAIDRARAREVADRALRDAAAAEVEHLTGDAG